MSVRGPLGATPQSAGLELAGASSVDVRGATTSSTARARLAIGVLVASGVTIAIAAANTGSLLPLSIRPVIGAPKLAGAFSGTGMNLHASGAIAVLALMTISYVIVAMLAAELSAKTVLMSIAALNLVVLFGPLLISTDVFSYQAYARMGALFGTNPYLNGPHALGVGDPVFAYIGAKWSYIPSVYGPVFTVLSYLLAPLSIASAVLAYKLIAGIAGLGIVALVFGAARLRGADPVRAAALVGLNPLFILYGVGGGHNDMLMLLAMVAAVYAILRYRDRLGGGLAVVAVGIKLSAGLLLPFALAAGGPLLGRSRRRDLLIGAGTTLAVLGALSLAIFGPGVFNLVATVERSQSEGDWHSVPGVLSGLGFSTLGHILGLILGTVFLFVLFRLLRRVWRGDMDWIDGAGWATVAMLLAASSLLPWYVTWLLPFAALATDRRLFKAALVFTCVVQGIDMLSYIPQGPALLGL
jgi:alpha-1,6-mannosyltransferase